MRNKTKTIIRHSAFALLFLFMLAGLIVILPVLNDYIGTNDIGRTAEAATSKITISTIYKESGTIPSNGDGVNKPSSTGSVGRLKDGYKSDPRLGDSRLTNFMTETTRTWFSTDTVLRLDFSSSTYVSEIRFYDIPFYLCSPFYHGIYYLSYSTTSATSGFKDQPTFTSGKWSNNSTANNGSYSTTSSNYREGWSGDVVMAVSPAVKVSSIWVKIGRGDSAYCGLSEIEAYGPTPRTITYNANSGTGAPGAQTIYDGIATTLSTTKPTRTNYSFQGWNTKSDGTGTNYASGASYTGSADVTLYAKWLNTYKVHYVGNGNTGGTMADTSHVNGVDSKLRKNAFTRTGYTFAGWFMQRGSDGYYLYWNATSQNSWSWAASPPSGKELCLCLDERTISSFSSSPGDTITATAQWKATFAVREFISAEYGYNSWDGTFNISKGIGNESLITTATVNGGSGKLYQASGSALYGSTVTLSNITGGSPGHGNNVDVYDSNYHVYKGYYITSTDITSGQYYDYIDGNYTPANGSTTVSVPINQSVVYVYLIYETKYNLAFNLNYTSSPAAPSSMTPEWSQYITLPTVSRAGYTFDGWYDSASGGTKIGDAGESVRRLRYIRAETSTTTPYTLYAHWTVNTYTVRFNSNDPNAKTSGGATQYTQTGFTYGTAKTLTANAFALQAAEGY
ncbi:MAG: InlB B-repeat-containing protein [Clostridia bacterium]|nr:InlB B-repeat-containing protein [Clostridia bacterium]